MKAILGFDYLLTPRVLVFELIMVAFKNNEYLRRIAENTAVKSVE